MNTPSDAASGISDHIVKPHEPTVVPTVPSTSTPTAGISNTGLSSGDKLSGGSQPGRSGFDGRDNRSATRWDDGDRPMDVRASRQEPRETIYSTSSSSSSEPKSTLSSALNQLESKATWQPQSTSTLSTGAATITSTLGLVSAFPAAPAFPASANSMVKTSYGSIARSTSRVYVSLSSPDALQPYDWKLGGDDEEGGEQQAKKLTTTHQPLLRTTDKDTLIPNVALSVPDQPKSAPDQASTSASSSDTGFIDVAFFRKVFRPLTEQASTITPPFSFTSKTKEVVPTIVKDYISPEPEEKQSAASTINNGQKSGVQEGEASASTLISGKKTDRATTGVSQQDQAPPVPTPNPTELRGLTKSEKKQRRKEIEAYLTLPHEEQQKARHVWMEKELDLYWDRVKQDAEARAERARKRAEAKQQKVKPKVKPQPLTRKQKQKEKRKAEERKKMEERAELLRLKECEKELLALKASQTRTRGPLPDPSPSSSYPNKHTAQLPTIPSRITLLQRAREEQARQKDVQIGFVVPSATASSVVLIKEEPTEMRISRMPEQVVPNLKEEAVEDVAAGLEHMDEGVDDEEFSFELVVDLKGLRKRKRDDSVDSLPRSSESTSPVPTITKVAISLESPTEYRIAVAGERPSKRLRDRHIIPRELL